VRRRTDYKDSAPGGNGEERDKERGTAENVGPFGTLKRTTTAPFSPGGTAAPWSASAGGTFAMGAFGSFGNSQPEKKAAFGSMRGESRFKGLMGKTSIEDFEKAPKEKASLSNLGKLNEVEPGKSSGSWMEARSNRPTSNDTDPFPDDDLPTGSAALRGGDDLSPPRRQGAGAFGTPQRPETRDNTDFSAFGMTADFHGRESYAHQTPHRAGGGHEPMSPTDTNPYQSPDHARDERDDESDGSNSNQNAQYPGMGSFQVDSSTNQGLHNTFGGFGGLGRVPGPFEIAASDRSQTSSVGPSRGFPTLPGLGLGGSATWGTGQQALGTPIRERGLGAFENAFGNVGEAQSPSLAGLGFGSNSGLGHATVGRGAASRLGSLFPTSMQEQMRNEQHRPSVDDGSSHGDRQQSMTGTFGRGAFGSQAPGGAVPNRDTDSPFRANRNLFDDFSGASTDEHGSAFGQATTSLSMAALNQTRTAQASTPGISSPASSQPPAAQQRTMVMPDRMRWIYRDPTGNTQGPFSGLEMHDWYKAGFFSPELLVKKQEEPDYEPLAQLIRRIGNSREPFLVPQIGIPHGPPTAQSGNAWAGSAGPATAPGAQPPFANSFPSFGTTLTAEQQNALERRKQEEQYLMARQKEHLAAQQQALARQVQIGGILPNQLQHQASAHSLHSQPSYGSITSPGGYQPSPTQGPAPGASVPGLIDNAFRSGPGAVPGLGPLGPGSDMMGNHRADDVSGLMDRLNLGRSGQPAFGTVPLTFGQQQPESSTHTQQVVAMLSDRARLQREQAEHDVMQRYAPNEQQNAQSFADRLQQFNDLRLQTDLDLSKVAPPPEGIIGKPSAPMAQSQGEQSEPASPESSVPQYHVPESKTNLSSFGQEPLSLTEQVQKAQSAKHSPQPQSAWNKVEPAIFPFPPAPSQSPLPAPAAQRKPIIAESLTTESRSGAATPAADTPSTSIAPWAKEPAEASRGPSLREIQEAEAKKAAEREALAASARREAFEKELLAQTQPPFVQPGLPSSSTWASGASPVTPSGNAASVWGGKPAVGKVVTPSGSMSKKTLQQIQKEEEARKQRAVAQATAAATVFGVTAPAPSAGKRYADLAGKPTAVLPSIPGVNSAWTTVGASGKTKAPGSSTPTPTAVRSTSTTIVPSVVKKPTVTRSTTIGGQSGKVNAEEEFRKWAVNELRHDLNKGINGLF
jgi:PERQ amino acid-rich with GYF domain-containing protein